MKTDKLDVRTKCLQNHDWFSTNMVTVSGLRHYHSSNPTIILLLMKKQNSKQKYMAWNYKQIRYKQSQLR